MNIEVSDAAAPEKVKKYKTEVVVDFDDGKVSQSDIQLLASLSPSEGEEIW
ncbi:MAG: hypothetical protein R2795_01780 [Saprospiraceae bacterium]